MRNLIRAFVVLGGQLVAARRITSGGRSFRRLSVDLVYIRWAKIRNLAFSDRGREVRLASGGTITYRRNLGDLQSIREVLMDEVYRPPFDCSPRSVVDLGGNIGLTSRWYSSQFALETLVIVEPSRKNVALIHRNVPSGAEVVFAAIGPEDGLASFVNSSSSNLGVVAGAGDPRGETVPQVSMSAVLEAMGPDTQIDLLKIDIEGGEEALLLGRDMGWLDRVRSIIIELHPDMVDCDLLIKVLTDAGFDYIPAGSAWPGSMDAFRRPEDSVRT
jgi:FkbM family methyltransferase